MSTRLGVRKKSEIISVSSRKGTNNKEYYDFDFGIRSYASRQQLAITQVEGFQELEWDRRLYTTLGTAKGRLYELRIQTTSDNSENTKVRIACAMKYKQLCIKIYNQFE